MEKPVPTGIRRVTEKYPYPLLAVLIILPRFIGLTHIALPAEINAVAAGWQWWQSSPPPTITPAVLFPFRAAEIAVTTVMLLWLYRRLRPVQPLWAAFATLLLAWEPIFAAYARLWQPEPLAALALLLLVVTLPDAFRGDDRTLWQAGAFAGIALAANAKLLPVAVGLSLVAIWLYAPRKIVARAERWLFWLVWTAVVWLLLSPAAWKTPAEFLAAALKISFAPPTAAPLWLIAALLSPVGLLGLAGFIVHRSERIERIPWQLPVAQIVFAGGWMLYQPHVSAAEMLVILLPMVLLAAWGWWQWLSSLSARRKNIVLAALAAGQLAGILWTAPYLVTFTNPLWGNMPIATHRFEIPDGVGLDAAAAWLNARPAALDGMVGTDTPQLLSPFYAGRLTAFTSPDAVFMVLTRAQQRAEKPSPTILRYYETLMSPEFSAVVRGQPVAKIYRAPAVQQAMALPRGMDTGILPKPIAFRPDKTAPKRGDSLTVDVIWLAPPQLSPTRSVLSVRSVIRFEADMVETEDIPPSNAETFAAATAPLQTVADGLVVSRHHLHLPADLSPGQYSLVSDGRPIGVITVVP